MRNFSEQRNVTHAKLRRRTPIFPLKVLKDNGDLFADNIYGFLNESPNSCNFPSILKLVSGGPVFKKVYHSFKEN